MYNKTLADKILKVAADASPLNLGYLELKKALPQFSGLPDTEWLTAIDALSKEGLVGDGGLVRIGPNNNLVKLFRLEITETGRQRADKNEPQEQMKSGEPELAYSLLQYLRIAARDRAVHKFNVIGKSGKGEFEQWLGRELAQSEKQTVIWIWDELRRLRLMNVTGTDLDQPDNWIVISEKGSTITESELARFFARDVVSNHTDRRLDGLLGIPDRAEFDKDFVEYAGQATAIQPFSLLMLDLDHFKGINDDFGHPVGDEVLRQTACAVGKVVMGKGEVYRYGGEEVVVFLPNHSLPEAMAVAERIRAAVQLVDVPSVDREITASLGVATFPDTTTDAGRLLENTDKALYSSKQNGRNRVTDAQRSSLGSEIANRAKEKHREFGKIRCGCTIPTSVAPCPSIGYQEPYRIRIAHRADRDRTRWSCAHGTLETAAG